MRVIASASSSRDRDEHVSILRHALRSQIGEISSFSATTADEELDEMIKSTLGWRQEKCSVLTVSFKLELRRVR